MPALKVPCESFLSFLLLAILLSLNVKVSRFSGFGYCIYSPSFQTPPCNEFSALGYLMKATVVLSKTTGLYLKITEKGYEVENHGRVP